MWGEISERKYKQAGIMTGRGIKGKRGKGMEREEMKARSKKKSKRKQGKGEEKKDEKMMMMIGCRGGSD